MRRPKLPQAIKTEVTQKCRRRCCICFGLNRDSGIKKGQFAHLDHDPTNNSPDNVVFLCLNHHDEYDGKTSQSASITKEEISRYRDELYRFVSDEFEAEQATAAGKEVTPSYWSFKQGPSKIEIENALDFHVGPHRTRSALSLLDSGPKSMNEFQVKIPGDPDWILVIVTALVKDQLAFGPSGDKKQFRISQKGERTLRILDAIPDFIKNAWWEANWKITR